MGGCLMIARGLCRLWLGLLAALVPSVATAQPAQGVVAMLSGRASLTRTAQLSLQPLRFKDALFEHDRIETGERSLVRVLLGGKALVTVRELSILTITEEAGPSTVNLAEGKLAMSVAPSRMRPGEAIVIRTPNAIAAVRGTVVVVEILPPTAPGRTPNTRITVTRGVVDVTPVGRTGSAEVSVRAGQIYDVAADHVRPLAPDETSSTFADLTSGPRSLSLPDDVLRSMWVREHERAATGAAFPWSAGRPPNPWTVAGDQALGFSPLNRILGVTATGLRGGGSTGRGGGGGVGSGADGGCAGVGQCAARGKGN